LGIIIKRLINSYAQSKGALVLKTIAELQTNNDHPLIEILGMQLAADGSI
jgi:hypothetical protein